jgi:hypothetical protein|eukprot:SAG25_NODE_1033_length_4221_cov_1.963852_4_plen_69_part_00
MDTAPRVRPPRVSRVVVADSPAASPPPFRRAATPPIAAGFFGTAGACAVLGFPKTKLADDTPLIGAGA